MSLPPGFLDELRARVTLSTVVGRAVTWDMRKSNMAKGDWWAPCPFHQEKSPSFHVDDRKGFYYCFGCHAKGDALTFLKENGNLGFMEAVEVLAREAGMQMPARDPAAAQRADRRTQLQEVMEEAVQLYRLQLKTAGAAAARDYLTRRRLTQPTQDRWDLGFAPNSRQFLIGALGAKGIAVELMEAAGLVARADDGSPYDRFRGRIIFPIRDARGKAISLGGRAMDPNAPAKYLNGPETELFDKGRNLYNLGPARDAAGKGQPLIVAEGYMDVIALVDAGFGATVAPLGTAVTEDQLRLMWRVHPEPVIALDGDKAGLRAALRVVDLALPLLEAGQGLRFALLPEGQDPDDLIRGQGAAAMQAVLDRAEPMVSLLWRRETEGRVFDSPERKASLDKTLRAAIAQIRDPSIRGHYGEEIRRLRLDLFGTAKPLRPFLPGRRLVADAPTPSTSTRASALARPGEAVEEVMLEAVLLATLATHPTLLPAFESDLEVLDLRGEGHDALRFGLLTASMGRIEHAEASAVLERLLNLAHVSSAPPVRRDSDPDLARMCLAEGFAKLDARRRARAEIAEAVADMDGLADEGLTWRLAQSARARHRAETTTMPDVGDMGEDRNALSKGLQDMIDGEIWIKRKG
jgi:DNA primase